MTNRDRERRERQKVSARKWAETPDTGGWTSLNVPDGCKFIKIDRKGARRFDFIPYICGVGNPMCDEGLPYFERTYFTHRGIGPNNGIYVCLAKTFNKACPVCEWVRAQERARVDKKDYEGLFAKKRQLWNVIDCDTPGEGIQVWEYSYALFGKNLKERLEMGRGQWDYFADLEDGFTVSIGFTEETMGSNKFYDGKHIDFLPRDKPLPDDLMDKAYNLDLMVKEYSYEALKRIMEGLPENPSPDEEESPPPSRESRVSVRGPEKEPTLAPNSHGPNGGYKVGDLVEYQGMECEVSKVLKDSRYIVVDEEGEDYRADAKDLKPWDTSKSVPPKRQEVEVEDDLDDDEEEESPPPKKKSGRR